MLFTLLKMFNPFKAVKLFPNNLSVQPIDENKFKNKFNPERRETLQFSDFEKFSYFMFLKVICHQFGNNKFLLNQLIGIYFR